ncbi:bifunctional precorrin-2 dehydrogenase/sirohydrochlorin ferrochelatase [Staphylococcus pseudoxylosus]|uniref:precorrin-2 dehydrogenase/sirohydrochlorin ferrochelatase family protein n=1 Tax=Staphylococcus pseudoxylosus TaxID=2282419 RepID=UPI000D1D3FB4|nr:NAD(P)-dependent oxidoreductase [Staphylococcus pseudoxylosus]MEB6036747.1 bifunctional precorrin-2 dehydrogenase/sirohydrochlorin ferrochelatase [Staphylococcus pseudoxylosus]MEB7764766.1 bifunctional precorrin-2 dehydrogenase/sirohydrochlorin ferrochelatase [Staphylococcus pseudoxylosus]MEB8086437.1 bifunctional precorrin-2 dehydrogenase/sirohydrochlorin ferrochelatase [Staphylococcus pseudoxylosus]PTI46160.1 preprotein translocase subunit TatB [Staphylococcus xylosus]
MYPIQLNVTNKQIVIIGGGKIAYRKLMQILKEDACSIRIISKKFLPQFFEIEHPKVKLLTKCYDKNDIKNASLIIAATDDSKVNDQIKRDAKAHQLVNHTSDQRQSDFFNMLEIEFEDIKICLRSNGNNCVKVKQISQAVQTYLTEVYKEDKHD